jgi:hypothetical protein
VDFAWWIATLGKRDFFDEALDVLDEFSREGGIGFPASVYLAEGARALIRDARGEKRLAADHAGRALAAAGAKHSGLRDHPMLVWFGFATRGRTLFTHPSREANQLGLFGGNFPPHEV